MEPTNEELIAWCAENAIHFQFIVQDGKLALAGTSANISAIRAIDEPIGQDTIGAAFLIVGDSIEHAARFHRKHGFLVGLPGQTGGTEAGD